MVTNCLILSEILNICTAPVLQHIDVLSFCQISVRWIPLTGRERVRDTVRVRVSVGVRSMVMDRDGVSIENSANWKGTGCADNSEVDRGCGSVCLGYRAAGIRWIEIWRVEKEPAHYCTIILYFMLLQLQFVMLLITMLMIWWWCVRMVRQISSGTLVRLQRCCST